VFSHNVGRVGELSNRLIYGKPVERPEFTVYSLLSESQSIKKNISEELLHFKEYLEWHTLDGGSSGITETVTILRKGGAVHAVHNEEPIILSEVGETYTLPPTYPRRIVPNSPGGFWAFVKSEPRFYQESYVALSDEKLETLNGLFD